METVDSFWSLIKDIAANFIELESETAQIRMKLKLEQKRDRRLYQRYLAHLIVNLVVWPPVFTGGFFLDRTVMFKLFTLL